MKLISETSGQITFEEPAWKVSASMTVDEAAACPLLEKVFWREEWAMFTFKRVQNGARKFSGGLSFQGQRLHSISMAILMPEDVNGWASWKASVELQRKKLHDELLAELFSPANNLSGAYDFPWGTVSSQTDQRDCFTVISVAYAQRVKA